MQPVSVRQRLLADPAFRAGAGLRPDHIVAYGDGPTFRKARLYDAVRGLFADGQRRKIDTVDDSGRQIEVALPTTAVAPAESEAAAPATRASRVVVSFDGEGGVRVEIGLIYLAFLSPDADARLAALDEITAAMGPTAPDPDRWRARLEAGPLDDDAIEAFADELEDSVPMRLRRIERDFIEGSVNTSVLVPGSLGYWERLCGPVSECDDQESWLRGPFVEHRRALLRRDTMNGLDLCLAMAVRDDLSPRVLIGEMSDDTLWAALHARCPYDDPFTLIAIADIAASRGAVTADGEQRERFNARTEETVRRLCARELARADGIDVYGFLPALLDLILDELRVIESMASRPAWWRRLCAWTHAALVVRALRAVRFDSAVFSEALGQLREPRAGFAGLLELREAPLWRPYDTTGPRVRAEVIGRLNLLQVRAKSEDRPLPGGDAIEKAVRVVSEILGPFAPYLPGPLECAGPPPGDIENFITEEHPEQLAELRASLTTNLRDPIWAHVSYLARIVRLDPTTLERATELVRQASFGEGAERRAGMRGMSDVCLIAASTRYAPLAEAALARCVRDVGESTTQEEAGHLLQLALMGAAAFDDADVGRRWLGEQLLSLASRLPRGAPCRALATSMDALKTLLPSTVWAALSRAEAMANLGS